MNILSTNNERRKYNKYNVEGMKESSYNQRIQVFLKISLFEVT